MSGMSEIESSLSSKAFSMLDKNHRTGELRGLSYDYTCPSPGAYPHQWLWDSTFHAIVLAHKDGQRAEREIVTLLAGQRDDGFMPCVNIWEKRFPFEEAFYINRITQPPTIPLAVEKIYERTKDLGFVEEVYPRLKKNLTWLSQNRDRNGNGLLEIIHHWEAGVDSIPSFDRQLGIKKPKPSVLDNFLTIYRILAKYQMMSWNEDKIYKSGTFIVENVLFNSIYARSLLAMVGLSGLIKNDSDQRLFQDQYNLVRSAILAKMWSYEDQIFYDLDFSGRQEPVKSVSSLMPLILPDLPREIVKPLIEKHLLNADEFWTPFPIASVPKSDPAFNPEKSLILWRGPSWVNTNWFLADALKNYGYNDEATHLVSQTASMVDKNGFWEFYNPISGEGYGQPNFGWSTLIVDMLPVK